MEGVDLSKVLGDGQQMEPRKEVATPYVNDAIMVAAISILGYFYLNKRKKEQKQ